ncbi:hypothetical protein [Sediminibacillus albus]|uniref:Uncharacterized protein n=1 Tax=Sediminibacillus albus TaxID=407036 RepID=A0A1G8Y9N5_9BACI|nr:hypothetical protein [Sediminibacillus albus]SDJ99441.1 hypothetical protein SAMN05216243_1485 [Sediminibacillus albus]
MDYIIFVLFVLISWGLLFRATKREKRLLGGISAVLGVGFIIGSQIVKLQSGFFTGQSTESSEAVGEWVLPGTVLLGVYLLIAINYRWIRLALTKTAGVKWTFIALDVLFSIAYLFFGYFLLFIIAFLYFPFAP